MGKQPKARSPAKQTKKAKRKAKEENQRERFIEAARAIGVDETGKEFERSLARIVKVKKRKPGGQ
jgi:hypothetical protein